MALRYRAAGAPRKLTLGSYPSIDLATARKRAQGALGDVAGGKDPAGAKKAARAAAKADDHRFDAVATLYVERYARKEIGAAWCNEITRQLRVEINPKLGAKQVGSITKNDVLQLVESIVDRGAPTTGNRVFATLRQIFNFALDRDLISTSPMPRSAPAPETKRDRVLSDGEIKLAWQAFDEIGQPFGAIGKLLLLTGARRDEIAAGA